MHLESGSVDEVLEKYQIPAHCRPGLKRYLEQRIRPGNFLCAVLANDFRRAVMLADPENLAALRHYALLIYNELPAPAWGDTYRVASWCGETERGETDAEISIAQDR